MCHLQATIDELVHTTCFGCEEIAGLVGMQCFEIENLVA